MPKKAAVEATPEEQLAAIQKIVDDTDEHRNRSRRESWDAIKAVLAGDAPTVVEESAPEAPPAQEEESSSLEEAATAEGDEAESSTEAETSTEEEAAAAEEGAAPRERRRRFAETSDEG